MKLSQCSQYLSFQSLFLKQPKTDPSVSPKSLSLRLLAPYTSTKLYQAPCCALQKHILCSAKKIAVLQKCCNPIEHYSDRGGAGTTPRERSLRLQLRGHAPLQRKQRPAGAPRTLNMLKLVTSDTWLMLSLINSSHSSSVMESFSSRSGRTFWRSRQAWA